MPMDLEYATHDEKLVATRALKFPKTLKQLDIYLGLYR